LFCEVKADAGPKAKAGTKATVKADAKKVEKAK